jgi:hypothetical protein
MDDFTKLESSKHMFKWLSSEPNKVIREEVERGLLEQVEDSVLNYFQVTSVPHWLTGAIPTKEDNTLGKLSRTGVAFEFLLSVTGSGVTHELTGVFTWVGVNLHKPGEQLVKYWIDIGGTLAQFGEDGVLKNRIYLR